MPLKISFSIAFSVHVYMFEHIPQYYLGIMIHVTLLLKLGTRQTPLIPDTGASSICTRSFNQSIQLRHKVLSFSFPASSRVMSWSFLSFLV